MEGEDGEEGNEEPEIKSLADGTENAEQLRDSKNCRWQYRQLTTCSTNKNFKSRSVRRMCLTFDSCTICACMSILIAVIALLIPKGCLG